MFNLIALTVYTIIIFVNSHSWLHCTKYDGTITGLDYDDSLCLGYTRNWKSYDGSSLTDFGAGDQLAYVGGDNNWCQHDISSPLSDNYDDTYPYATYYLNETITLVWPAKNHATHEDCPRTSPDSDMVLYYNDEKDPTSDPATISNDWKVVIDWHEEDGTSGSDFAIAGRPFSNCPGFCDDSDKTPCIGQFQVTEDLFSESGMYTFMWYWSGSGAYSMCYEAYVDVDVVVNNGNDDSDSDDDTDTDTDTDTTNNDNDDNNNDDDDSSDTVTYYDISVTVCYSGDTYDADNIEDAMDSLFSNFDWTVVSYFDIDEDEFNVTVKVYSTLDDQASVVESMNDGSLCDAILDEYNDENNDECSIDCSLGVYINADSSYTADSDDDDDDDVSNSGSNNSGSNSDDSTMSIYIVIIVLLVILIIIAALILYSKIQTVNKNANGNNKNGINNDAQQQANIIVG